eukprot:10896898-Heterocapsa_arctica.AAC.1
MPREHGGDAQCGERHAGAHGCGLSSARPAHELQRDGLGVLAPPCQKVAGACPQRLVRCEDHGLAQTGAPL